MNRRRTKSLGAEGGTEFGSEVDDFLEVGVTSDRAVASDTLRRNPDLDEVEAPVTSDTDLCDGISPCWAVGATASEAVTSPAIRLEGVSATLVVSVRPEGVKLPL